MEIEFTQPASADEYRDLVQWYSYLVDAELIKLEEATDEKTLAERIPHIISAVNVIGYLRGQHNMFIDERPPLDFQSALYKNEDAFEQRMESLISRVTESEFAGIYRNKLRGYYLDFRGGISSYNSKPV